MPDYVYAVHDFSPENDDEISFQMGDRIEVIERDDVYGDGWWQGRNLDGKTGLFPQSYTSFTPPSGPILSSTDSHDPSVSQTLKPLQEETDSLTTNGVNPISNGHGWELSQGDGEVMKATMTDVQQAIEQLGRNDGNSVRDDARSFSFASSRTGEGDLTDHETDTDIDIETDRETGAAGQDWHRGARIKLAEQARKVVEEEKKKQEQDQLPVMRNVAPPIEVEMSDESEGEDDEDDTRHHSGSARAHPYIPEEEEEEEGRHALVGAQRHGTGTTRTTGEIDLPAPDDSQIPTATPATFPTIPPVTGITRDHAETISSASLPTPTSPNHVIQPPEPPRPLPETRPVQANTATNTRDPFVALPSPVPSSISHPQYTSKHSSLASSAPSSLQPLSEQAPARENTSKKAGTYPSEWTVEEVVDWLKSKSFGEDVCAKFIEQEITGDVLLDLDVNLLKSEIGIPAFGKRMRIANAITDLRRPPSVIYSDHAPAQSQSNSQSPTYGYSHSHNQSFQSSGQTSMHSPVYPGGYGSIGMPPSGYGTVMSPISMSSEGPTHPGDIMGNHQRRVSDPASIAGLSVNVTDTDDGTNGIRGAMERSAMLGLGLGLPAAANGQKYRPAQLMLSPSDSNLGSKTKAIAGDIPQEADEERAFMSENDAGPSVPSINKRRRMFGRSAESGSSSTKRHSIASKHSNEANSPLSSQHQDPHEGGSLVSRHSRGKRSVDGNKASDRLSLFGNPFNASVGKTRKPAPRYSTYVENSDAPSEKASAMNLSRLYGGGARKVSGRPGTADGSYSPDSTPKKAKVKDEKKEREQREEVEKDPAVLRKRTMSTPMSSPNESLQPRGMQALKPGYSFFEQIGEIDHSGWMRKRGDRYNSWKSRYFVLKGSDLYILKSADRSQTKIKGYINIVGYKVLADENTDPGRYGFRIVHDTDKTHFFSSAEQNVIREWMKAIMKSTIGRDYSKAVISSCNIPTIPLTVAQAMSPAPRPPSPTARAATQKAHRQENPHRLTSRDVRVLMGLPGSEGVVGNGDSPKLDQFFSQQGESKGRGTFVPVSPKTARNVPPPPRPSREMRSSMTSEPAGNPDADLIEWANSHLPKPLQITDPVGSLCGGLALLRLAESIKGKPSSPPVADSAFPTGPNDDRLEGYFRLFDFLLDNDVKTGTVSINEVRQGKREKIVQLLKALKAWDDKRKAIADLAKGGHNPTLSPYGMLWGQM